MEHVAKLSLLMVWLQWILLGVCGINVICCVIMCFYWNTLRQVIVTSQFLGAVFAVGFIMACFSRSFTTLGLHVYDDFGRVSLLRVPCDSNMQSWHTFFCPLCDKYPKVPN